MNATNNIATDLFYKIRSRFLGLKLGNEAGEITILPEEARFFDFDYVEDDTPIGHVSISLAEDNSMKVYFSHGITENMDARQKANWYGFLKELRVFAKRRLLSFDTRDIAKDNLDQRDYSFLSKNSLPKQPDTNTIQKPIGESAMGKNTMYGSKTISYQKLMDTRLIIKHNQTLQDDTARGARSRNISALFVENQDGERFKYPFVHLAGARAMQRHIANGGVPYDAIGESMIKISEEIAQLKGFSNYVVRNDLMNSETNSIVERGASALTELRKQLSNLSSQKHYDAYKENFQAREALEISDETIKEYTEKFTVHNFKDDIKEAFPVLFRLMQKEEMPIAENITSLSESRDSEEFKSAVSDFEQALFDGGIHGDISDDALVQAYYEFKDGDVYEAATTIAGQFIYGDGTPVGEGDEFDTFVDELSAMIHPQHELEYESRPMEEFESWVIALGEENSITSKNELERNDAIRKLQPLISEPLTAGVDGINAIESIKGIIDDQQLTSKIKEMSVNDSEADVRPLIKEWLQARVPGALAELQFSEVEEAEQEPQAEYEKIDTQGLAEFMHSFYDRDAKTFPKGPEGVCTMVGKKFGEQAESAARMMAERMAPQQAVTDDQTRIHEESLSECQLSSEVAAALTKQGVRNTGGRENEDEIFKAAGNVLQDMGYNMIQARHYFRDEDFVADLFSALETGKTEDLARMQKLSGIE